MVHTTRFQLDTHPKQKISFLLAALFVIIKQVTLDKFVHLHVFVSRLVFVVSQFG